MTRHAACTLCNEIAGVLIWQDKSWRVVRVLDEAFPAFYRVIAQRHIAEMSQLQAAERVRCMDLVFATERALIEQLSPTKINLAALGNMTPHLHWHVIARFDWDSHFPQPVWGQAQREVIPVPAERLACSLDQLDVAVRAALN